MYRTLQLLLLSAALACVTANAAPVPTPEPVLIKGHPADPTRIIARVAPGSTRAAHAAALATTGMSVVQATGLVPGQVVLEIEPAQVALSSTGSGAAVAALAPNTGIQLLARIETLRATGLYEYVEPDYIVTADALPTDARFVDGTLWGLRNLGLDGGRIGVDVDASGAWEITTGSTGVIVAVIDTGILYTHADLATQMWRNSGEVPANGLDDDHNGYVDDVFGIDAITRSGNPRDYHGHGTHVAGTIGAAADNDQQHVGVAWKVRLMACKFLGASGGRTSDAIACVDYAVAQGATILNNSWGGGGYSQGLRDAIAAAGARGVVFVAAAGNHHSNNDEVPHYPSSYDLENIIAVASCDRDGALSSFSSYGRDSVDIVAPGRAIFSCINVTDTSYGVASGTSMATPHVSGVAALVAAGFPGIPMMDLRDRIINSARITGEYDGAVWSRGRLDALRALTMMPDGRLEVAVTPSAGGVVFVGRNTPVAARVTDLVAYAGGTVSARIEQTGATFSFRDDGVAPDVTAGDARFAGAFVVPNVSGALDLVITAEAPGKVMATRTVSYFVMQPPANDHFAQRALLVGKADSDNGSNFGATSEPGEPAHAARPANRSLWWTWTAPETTAVTITTKGSAFDTILAVYSGSALATLAPIASNDDATADTWLSEVNFGATKGDVYQIAVDGFDGDFGPVGLELSTAIGPANDLFANATLLAGPSIAFTGNLYNATREPGEPSHGLDPPVGSIWWRWTASTDGTVHITGGVDAIVVYTGMAVDALTPIHLTSEGNSSGRDFRFSAVAGMSYAIAVSGRPVVGTLVDDFSMSLSLDPPPVNDHFARRTVLSGTSHSVTGTTEHGTREAGEPAHGRSPGSASIWWTWTAPAAGSAVFGVSGAGSYVLAVYSGETISSLTALASTDQGWPGIGTRYATVSVVAGATYQIALAGARGPYTWTMQLWDAPPNDAFAGRIPVTGASVDLVGDTTGATREAGEPVPFASGSGRTLWWSWTAPWTGTATLTSGAGSGGMAVYTGESLAALRFVANTTPSPIPSRFVFHAVSGVSYQIYADGLFSHIGALGYTLTLKPAPANDMFADRSGLAGAVVAITASTAEATVEAGEPSHGQGLRSVWWSWQAPASGPVQISTAPFAVSLDIHTGSDLATLTRLGGTAGARGGFNFDAVAGTTYAIATASVDPQTSFPLTVYQGPRPLNDRFADRVRLSGSGARATGGNRGASVEPGESAHGTAGMGMTVWWAWTAPANGPVVIDTLGSDFDTALAVYTGSSVSQLSSVGANSDDPAGGKSSRVMFPAQAGVEYQIVVDGEYDATGAVVLNLSQRPPPANDRFAARTVVSGESVSVPGDAFGSARDPGEPPLGGVNPSSTVWYEWTAPLQGVAVVRVNEAQFTPVIGVFTGGALGALTPVENLQYFLPAQRVAFRAERGAAYQIGIGSSYGTPGRFTLSIEVEPHPVNDEFAQRALLSGSSVTGASTTVGASRETGEPRHAGLPVNCSVWWTWTAPATGAYKLNTSGSSSGSILAVYTGTAVDALTSVASVANSANGNRLDLAAVAGVAYQIAVAHPEGLQGPVCLTIHDGQPPVNDDFEYALPLAGLEATAIGHNRAATAQPGEPLHDGATGATSVWWTWTAPLSTRVLFTTAASNFDTTLAVYAGDSVGALVAAGSNADASGAIRTSAILIDVAQDTTYRIAVTGARDAMGDIALAVIAGIEPVAIALEASAASVVAGGSFELSASAFGTGPLEYQWSLDGVQVDGANGATLVMRCAQAFHGGVYTVRIHNAFGSKTSGPMAVAVSAAPASAARLMNLSTRALCQTGDNILIPGFVINGAGTKKMLIRGVGPTLGGFGVGGTLVDPQMTLTRDGALHASNDDWGTNTNVAEIITTSATVGAFALATGSADAALLLDLPAGQYTVMTSGKNAGTGVAMVELYDADPGAPAARLVNISNRGFVGTGESIMIPGFVVSNEGARTFLVRAVGPTLADFGVGGTLADPQLTVFSGTTPILANDNWDGIAGAATTLSAAAEVGAFPLGAGSRDAAFVVTLPPGIYTVHASGVGSATGVALVEVYLVP